MTVHEWGKVVCTGAWFGWYDRRPLWFDAGFHRPEFVMEFSLPDGGRFRQELPFEQGAAMLKREGVAHPKAFVGQTFSLQVEYGG